MSLTALRAEVRLAAGTEMCIMEEEEDCDDVINDGG